MELLTIGIIKIIALGLIKVLDNVITTAKSITTYQNKKIITSILVIISQFLFYFVIKSVVADSSVTSIMVVCICSGLGTFIAMFLNDKYKRDDVYTNILTCSCTDNIDALCDYLLAHKIKCISVDSYSRNNQHTKTVFAFAKTKHESEIIDLFLEKSEIKYLRQILK